MKRPPSYVQQLAEDRFYFRISVPKALRPYFRQREIKKSLNAERLSEAFGMAQALAARVQQAFDECTAMTKKREAPWLHQIIITSGHGDNRQEIQISRDDPAEEIAIAQSLLKSLPETSLTVPRSATPIIGLQQVIQEYVTEKLTPPSSWTPKTHQENQAIFDLLIAIVGDVPVNTVDGPIARHVKQTIQRLPPNINKNPLYRDKPLNEVLALSPSSTLLINTVNKYLNRISSLFDWARNQQYVAFNPFPGLSVKKNKRAHEERDEFAPEDLAALFGSPIFTRGEFRQPYYYWLPLIALYTGARLEEICQLHLADIRQEGQVWILDINEDNEKAVKTSASKRLVPVHPELERLGLLEYVQRLNKKGETRLFPELKLQRDGYSQAAQKWFNARYRHSCGISHRRKSFHSFRHTFINFLKQHNQDGKKIAALAGHAEGSVTLERYGKPYPPEALVELVKVIDYGLHLSKVFVAR